MAPTRLTYMLAHHERATSPLRLVGEAVTTSPATQLPRPLDVKATLTPKRPRRQVENDEYGAFARRILRAYARRVGDGDVEALTLMVGLADELDTAIAESVKGLRARGYSWAEIGARLGITRQAAQQRWGTSSLRRVTALRYLPGDIRSVTANPDALRRSAQLRFSRKT